MAVAEVQLKLIADVVRVLEAGRVDHWLWGGWAVDFLVGRVTRPHRDVEFLVWERDRDRLEHLLINNDYASVEDRPTEGKLVAWKYQHEVEFYRLTWNEAGDLVTPGEFEYWPWPSDSISGEHGRLGQVTSRIVSAGAQLATKTDYSTQVGVPLRAKDRHDIELLRAFLSGGPTV